jgi:uncharacterized membrane protein YhaH (DUF805 family)
MDDSTQQPAVTVPQTAPDMPKQPAPPAIFSLSLAGRSGRLNYINISWVYCIPLILLGIAALYIPFPVYFLLLAVFMVPIARSYVLRLHDVDKPGWLAVPIVAIGIISCALTFSMENYSQSKLITWFILYSIYGIVCIILMVYPGSDGANKYGEQPRRGSMAGLIVLAICTQIAIAGMFGAIGWFAHEAYMDMPY